MQPTPRYYSPRYCCAWWLPSSCWFIQPELCWRCCLGAVLELVPKFAAHATPAMELDHSLDGGHHETEKCICSLKLNYQWAWHWRDLIFHCTFEALPTWIWFPRCNWLSGCSGWCHFLAWGTLWGVRPGLCILLDKVKVNNLADATAMGKVMHAVTDFHQHKAWNN